MAKKKSIPASTGVRDGSFPEKRPANSFKDYNADRELVCWHVGTMDLEGPFSWKKLHKDDWVFLLGKMKNFETMKWSELPEKQHHPIAVNDLVPLAKERLKILRQDDLDTVFSISLEGRPRLIGIRDRHIFKMLWWDPDHQVCPSTKKHT